MNGNCYATSEAAYHLLGGKAEGWKPMRISMPGEEQNHWFLQHETGVRLDLTESQYKGGLKEADYARAVGCGFLTKGPSRRAREMMERMVWA